MSLSFLVLFGAVQGITEFLPVSSSGHLLLLRHLFIPYNQPLTADIVFHAGSLLAIIYFFKNTIKKNHKQLILPLIISSLPAVLVSLLALDQIEAFFDSPRFLFLSFSVTTIILLLFNQLNWGQTGLSKIKLSTALKAGLFQALAIVPGISRSASTIFAGKFLKLNPNAAFSFAFLMAIPAILGSIILSATKFNLSTLGLQPQTITTAFLSSFLFSLLTLSLLQKILSSQKLSRFAPYTAALAALSLAFFF